MMHVDILSIIILFLDIDDILSLFKTNTYYNQIKTHRLLWQQLIKRDYSIYNINTYELNAYKNVYEFENKLIINPTIWWSMDAMTFMYQLYNNTFFNQYVHILNQQKNNYMTSHQIVKILYKSFTNGKTLSVLDAYISTKEYQDYNLLVTNVILINSDNEVDFYVHHMNKNVYYCHKDKKKDHSVKHGTALINYFLMVDLFMEILEQRTHYNNIYQIKLLETIDKIISCT